MARKLRVQFEGAIYHVINRGNYRRDIFESAGTARAFETCLWECAERSGWRLHAFTLMRNHYHLALEVPRGNLVEGMHWLQSTFATRFNRFRQERGHLFQSRYQALLVQPGPALFKVVNYIHLNPVRAGIVPVEQLASFRWSSLRRFLKGERPGALVCADWLRELKLADDASGWEAYLHYLRWLAADAGEQERLGFESLSRGWAIGAPDWRERVAKNHASGALVCGAYTAEMAELRSLQWTRELEELLKAIRKNRQDLTDDWKGADWKVALAHTLRQRTTATNAWIARELHMGAASSVSQYLSLRRREQSKN